MMTSVSFAMTRYGSELAAAEPSGVGLILR
jgi:hypothetical protein